MYLLPAPMRPDTFSQYGYSDASNLRALRRGYGHDIYPQYPTTYNMPRVIAGLGAFTRNGYTVDYYAKSGSLSFADKNLKNLYEGMRNADIDFQKNAAFVLNGLKPAFSAIEFATAGQIKAADVRAALSLKLPTWGVALVLEVAAGKRPADQAFRAMMAQCAKDMGGAKAAFAVITGVNGVASGIAAATGVGAPIVAVTGTIAGVAASAVVVAALLEPTFKALASGKPPSRREMKQMMEASAKLSGQKAPSSTQIDKLVEDFDKAMKAPPTKAATPPASTGTGNPALRAKQAKLALMQPTVPGAAETAPPASKPFPIVPVALGAAALVGVALLATRRKGK